MKSTEFTARVHIKYRTLIVTNTTVTIVNYTVRAAAKFLKPIFKTSTSTLENLFSPVGPKLVKNEAWSSVGHVATPQRNAPLQNPSCRKCGSRCGRGGRRAVRKLWTSSVGVMKKGKGAGGLEGTWFMSRGACCTSI
jgi:hypothetical protein